MGALLQPVAPSRFLRKICRDSHQRGVEMSLVGSMDGAPLRTGDKLPIGKEGAKYLGQCAVKTMIETLFDIYKPDSDCRIRIEGLAEKASDFAAFIDSAILQDDLPTYLSNLDVFLIQFIYQAG